MTVIAQSQYTVEELEAMLTLAVGQTADLKIQTESFRVWLNWTGIDDGEPADNLVTYEQIVDGRWEEVAVLRARESGDE